MGTIVAFITLIFGLVVGFKLGKSWEAVQEWKITKLVAKWFRSEDAN